MDSKILYVLEFNCRVFSKDSESYASLAVKKMMGVTVLLKNNPGIKHVVPEAGKDDSIQEVILGYYRII